MSAAPRDGDFGPLLGEHQPLGPLALQDRRRLVAQRGDVLRLLLDQCFASFCDTQDLHPYGFKGADPVADAVDWAIEFFTSERFKPEKLRDHTTRLFTCADFWLTLKVGRQALGARRGWRRVDKQTDELPAEAPLRARAAQDAALAATQRRMAETLGQLRARTCAGLVQHWLEGSERLRATLYDWELPADTRDEDLSKKRRSFLRHDAQLRYICLFLELLDQASADGPHQAALRSAFAPCEDQPPYRVEESEVAAGWTSNITPRAVQTLRKQGMEALLLRALDEAEARPSSPTDRLRALLLRHGLSKTTAHALKLRDTALIARLGALPAPELRG